MKTFVGASLSAFLFSNPDLSIKQLKGDFILSNSLKILRQIKGVLNLPELSFFAPICHNPSFKPGLMDQCLHTGQRRAL